MSPTDLSEKGLETLLMRHLTGAVEPGEKARLPHLKQLKLNP